MAKTKYLNLNIVAASEDGKTFKNFRNEIAGDTAESNFVIIDEEVGAIKQKIANEVPDKDKEVLSATKLKTPRTISISNDAIGSGVFDGSGNINIQLEIPSLDISKISGLGSVADKDTGVGSGQIPIINSKGKLDESIMPAITITDTYEVSSESEMLNLAEAQRGDIAVRSDISKCFILKHEPYSEANNWTELKTPTDFVLSVNGQTGVVNIDNINGNAESATKLETARMINGVEFDGTEDIVITDDSKASKDVATTLEDGLMSADDKTKLDSINIVDNLESDSPTDALSVNQGHILNELKAPIESPTFTGTPTAPNGVDYGVSRIRNIHAGTADMTAGSTALPSGSIYLVYE